MREASLVLMFAALAIACAIGNACGSETIPATQPSSVIVGVSWDFGHGQRLAHGSDLWPTTWAADGNIYSGWGDGGGFDGDSDTRGRVSLGFARISGLPPDLHGANVWGDHKNGFATNQATFGGKPVSLLCVDGVLYAFVTSWGAFPGRPNPVVPQSRLAWSADLGASWTQSDWKLEQKDGQFYGGTFLNFGRDYAGARDGYIYIYGALAGRRGVVLARIPRQHLRQLQSYQFFAGEDAQGPIWKSAVASARSVFVDPQRAPSEVLFTVVYNAPLHRYLATWSHDGTIGGLWLLDAPQPWGPWTVAATYSNWGGFGIRESLLWSFPAKWISTDGRTLWCVYSAGRLRPDDGMLDSFNLVKLTLTTR